MRYFFQSPGHRIWINFDRHSLLNLIQQCAGTFVADIDEIRPQYTQVAAGGQVFSSSVVRSAGPSIGATINNLDALTITSAGQQKQVASPWYSDQVLPFDVTLSGANEYGAMCSAKIFGVEILNEGWGISIDDAVTEMQATFVAAWSSPCRRSRARSRSITRSLRPAGHKQLTRARAGGPDSLPVSFRPAGDSVTKFRNLQKSAGERLFPYVVLILLE
jgi:hypothetical protein